MVMYKSNVPGHFQKIKDSMFSLEAIILIIKFSLSVNPTPPTTTAASEGQNINLWSNQWVFKMHSCGVAFI